MMHSAFVALGANLGNPEAALEAALRAIDALPATQLVRTSSFYRTEPIESSGPDYVNAVCEVETGLSPEELLTALLAIESNAGRVRPVGVVNAPRTLDLDLLLYEAQTRSTEFLKLPHPRMHERAFVLVPLAEIAPDLTIPGKGSVVSLLRLVSEQRIEKIA